MVKDQYLYSDLTEKIIGCAMRVHSFFGMGFPETVNKRALMIELDKLGINYKSEEERNIYYEGRQISKRRLDLIVEGKVLVELKAIKDVDKSYWNQILNYLKVFDLAVGLHLNFGAESLQFKRFIYTKGISGIRPKSLNL